MTEQLNLTPKRRFKEFRNTHAWEQRGFSELFTTLQHNALSRAELNSEQGVAMNVHYGDVLIKFGELLDVRKEKVPFITDDTIVSKYKSSLLNNGDVIIADAAEDSTVGKCSEIAGLTDQIIISGLHTIPCRPIQFFASGYLGYYMNSRAYHDQLLPLIQGTKVSSISKSALSNTVLVYPESKEEQLLIAKYFTNLDNLITLHKRKVEKTKALKSAYLSEMFPAEGKQEPKRRFAGFTQAWEQRKLKEVATYRNGKAHEKDISDIGSFIVINSKFVSTNGQIRKFANKQIEPLEKNEIAFVLSDVPNGRAIARTFLVLESNKYSLNQRIAGITPNDNTDPYFLSELMNRHHYFLRFDDGVGQTNLSKKEVEDFEVLYPVFEEQQKIGRFFSQLDNLIAVHQRKLEKLQNLKKAYQHQMFV